MGNGLPVNRLQVIVNKTVQRFTDKFLHFTGNFGKYYKNYKD